MTEINDLLRERRKKLEAIRALGVDAFGGRFEKDCPIRGLHDGFEENKKVKTAGRLTAMRFMGKSVFCDLRDESGKIQLFVKREDWPEAQSKLFDALDLGDIVGVEGELFKTKTGENTLRVHTFRILAKSLRPMPEKWHGLKDVELRYRQRYLDLMANEATKDIFIKRSKIVQSIRRTLDEKGYLEVETPMMHPIPGGAAGRPFTTHHEALDLDLYLRVAPELYLKRLLVGGFDKVYEVNKSFRNEGISTRHNPEFTMLEVYTAYHDVNDVMALCEELVKKAATDVFGGLKIESGGLSVDFSRWERRSFAQIMKDKYDILPDDSTEAWIKKLAKKGIQIEAKKGEISRTFVINLIGDAVAPGKDSAGSPVFITDYFSELSPLARNSRKNPLLSDRFELYVGGMEIANGYSEQNDPILQKKRFEEELAEKKRAGEKGLLDEDYIHALEHGMPPAGGLGIGIDRLVMLLTGQPSIREVILFPQMRGEGKVTKDVG